MLSKKDRQRFERLTMPHLSQAYNLARWLVKDPAEAEDIVQTAYMKAFEAFHHFTGNNTTAWMMTIVRNTAYNWLSKQKRNSNLISFDEILHGAEHEQEPGQYAININPEQVLHIAASKTQLAQLMARLPTEFREVLFLREIEGYSYQEITDITQVPKGTVMSRLSRARQQMQKLCLEQQKREQANGM